MNGAGSYSNSSFNHDSWFGGRSQQSLNRLNIENDLYRGTASPNFLTACSSFLQLRLQERVGGSDNNNINNNNNNLITNGGSQYQYQINRNTNLETCSVLRFANSCIQLQNFENYSHHMDHMKNEISNANADRATLQMDQILPKPLKEPHLKLYYSIVLKNIRNQFAKFKNIFKGTNTTNNKIIHLEMKKSLKLVTQSTQTDLSTKKFKHIKKPNATTLKGRSSRMSIPEEVKEYQSWKAKFCNEMKTKRQRVYKCPMTKCNSCMEVVETKVQTKKFTKMRRQSSKLSVLNEDREYDDEFEAYWSQVKMNNSRRF